MRYCLVRCGCAVIALPTLLLFSQFAVAASKEPFDSDQGRSEWVTNGRTYSNLRFSPLDQINTINVKSLVPRWIFQTGKAATFQTTPLVARGVMFVSEPFSAVFALDATNGEKLWHYEHKISVKKICCGPANRGVGLGYGKVFVATVDAHLVALDTAAASGQSGIGANSAPLVYDGKVFIGVTGVGYGLHLESERPGAPLGTVIGVSGKFGQPGFLAAFDVETGARIWQFDTTQRAWEGNFVAKTAYGVPLPRDIAKEKHAKSANQDAWRFGGGTVWHTPALDPVLGLLYFGTGNPSPQATGDGRPGDNLYTVSLLAVDVNTGKLRWYFQQVPHDMWGYDVASPPSLFDVTVDGRVIPAVGEASKLGWYFVNDRRNGKFLYKSEPFVPQENLFKAPSSEGITISPGVGGGASWSPASVDSRAQVVYVAAMHLPTTFQTGRLPAASNSPPIEYTTSQAANVPNWGTLTALDLQHSGKIIWQAKTPKPLVGGVLATAGGLVFTGEGNGNFDAFDSKNGRLLWHFNCGAGVNAPPISYSIDDKQYVAVAAGGSAIWGYPQGDALIVFGLP